MLSLGFILQMLFAVHLSGNMLQQQGLLRGTILSPASIPLLLRKLAEQRANLTPRQRRKLIQSRLHVVLCGRLLGRQSWQHSPMNIPVHVLRHLMTMGIPRQIRITPLSIPQKLSSTFSRGDYNVGDWTQSFPSSIENMTTHPCEPLIAITGSNGMVWMGKIDNSKQMFRLIHNPKSTENERAKTCAFHPLGGHLVVAITGYVLIYEVSSSSLDSKLLPKARFHEAPNYFCTRPPQFSACDLQWHPSGTFFTAISDRNWGLSRRFDVDPVTFAVKFETKHGYLFSMANGHFPPLCSCCSSDGKFVATGYPDGKIMIQELEDNGSRSVLKFLKITGVLPAGRTIEQMQYCPSNSSFLAIKTSFTFPNEVHFLKIAPDGSIKIHHTIPNATGFHFNENLFLVSSGNRITFYLMNSDNIPVKMTEFQSQGSIGSFLLTSVNGNVTLLYSHRCGGSDLYKAEITFE